MSENSLFLQSPRALAGKSEMPTHYRTSHGSVAEKTVLVAQVVGAVIIDLGGWVNNARDADGRVGIFMLGWDPTIFQGE